MRKTLRVMGWIGSLGVGLTGLVRLPEGCLIGPAIAQQSVQNPIDSPSFSGISETHRQKTQASPVLWGAEEVIYATSSTVIAGESSSKEGWALYKQGQYTQAVAKFQQAAQRKPKDPKPHWGLTLAYNKLQRYNEALIALNKAAQLDPAIGFTTKDSYTKLRSALERKAKAATKPAAKPTGVAKITPTGNPNKDGWAFYKAGQYNKAAEQFQKAIQANPNNPKPYWGLTLSYNKLQRPHDALKALNQAAKIDPAISFTTRDTYNKLRQTLERKATGVPASQPQTSPAPTPITQADSGNGTLALIGMGVAGVAGLGGVGYLLSRRSGQTGQGSVQNFQQPMAQGFENNTLQPFFGNDGFDSLFNDDRAACFFCSCTLHFDEVQEVNVGIGGRPQRVLCCQSCAGELRQGGVPGVRSFAQGNDVIPWFYASAYDPFQHYDDPAWSGQSVSLDQVRFDRPPQTNFVILPSQSEYREYRAQQIERNSPYQTRNAEYGNDHRRRSTWHDDDPYYRNSSTVSSDRS